jgi:hypothetical protein
MSDRTKKDDSHPDHPMRDPASAAKLFAELREADPLTALRDLSAWLEEAKDISGDQEKARGDILALIQEAGDMHVVKLLAQFIARQSDQQAARESNWNALNHYMKGLTGALCASARHLFEQAERDPSLQLLAAAGAARALHACRMMAKLYLVHYLSVPPKLWQLAYVVHGDAEKADCAAKHVRMHAAQKAPTTVTQELLRLVMLQSSSTEMMTPEQIEVADRVIDMLGGDFTLHPRGSADNAFRFDPGSDQPPQRATDRPPEPDADIRYFGPGMGIDALLRLHTELAQMRRAADTRPFGKDIPPHVQVSAIRHLLLFWGQASPYTAPARTEAAGTLLVIHGYAQIWQHLSSVRSATSEMSLAQDGDGPAQAPETWTVQDTGGNELGAEIPPRSSDWARSGDVVAVSMHGDGKYWLGLIRSMHAEPGHGMRANIAILSREPQAGQLRLVIEQGDVNAFTENAARQFAFNSVRAIILSDGSTGSQKANFLLPPEHWEGGRVYEGTVAGTVRQLHSLQLLRRGDDYVRASFEWVSVAQA